MDPSVPPTSEPDEEPAQSGSFAEPADEGRPADRDGAELSAADAAAPTPEESERRRRRRRHRYIAATAASVVIALFVAAAFVLGPWTLRGQIVGSWPHGGFPGGRPRVSAG